jgi:hypothetical protein
MASGVSGAPRLRVRPLAAADSLPEADRVTTLLRVTVEVLAKGSE